MRKMTKEQAEMKSFYKQICPVRTRGRRTSKKRKGERRNTREKEKGENQEKFRGKEKEDRARKNTPK